MLGSLFLKNGNVYYFTNTCETVGNGILTMENPKIRRTFYEARYIKDGQKHCEKATHYPLLFLRSQYKSLIESAIQYAYQYNHNITLEIGDGCLYTDIETPDWVNKTQEDAERGNSEYLDKLEALEEALKKEYEEEDKKAIKKKKSLFSWFILKEEKK